MTDIRDITAHTEELFTLWYMTETSPAHTEQNSYSPSGTWQRPSCCQAPSSAPPCTPQRHLSLTDQPSKVVSVSQSLVYHVQALATICSGHARTKPQRDCWNLGKNHCIDSYSADHHLSYASSLCVYMHIHTYMCVCVCVCVRACMRVCESMQTCTCMCLCDHFAKTAIFTCPSLMCSFNRVILRGLPLWKCAFDVCVCVFYFTFALGRVLLTDLRKGLHMRRVLKCDFAYDGVWLSWADQLWLIGC